MSGDASAGLDDKIEPAQKRSKAAGLNDDDIALKNWPSGAFMSVAGKNHVKFRRFAGDFAGNR